MSVPWESVDYRAPPESDQVNCLHLTSILNTLPCSLVASRDSCRPAVLIRAARVMSVAVKQSGHVAISLYCALSLWALFHQLLLLPPPISLPQCLFICIFIIPLLASTPFSLDQVFITLHFFEIEFFFFNSRMVNRSPVERSLSLNNYFGTTSELLNKANKV